MVTKVQDSTDDGVAGAIGVKSLPTCETHLSGCEWQEVDGQKSS